MYKARQLRKLIIRADSIFCWQNMSSGETLSRPVESLIRKKLEAGLKPLYCDIINESYMHNVPKGSETHFKVVIVSDKFDKQPLIKRHRMINELLQTELQEGVHALSIIAKTPEQWEVSDKTISASPACRGGFGK
ncbi:DNA-binding transcriptional regulator BolA isoform X1 [Linepithema humile]|uniref:DNA-binding transcriptional regulator BolA isoform X1 n=1 Tax=Linepithema humile TaxID=83485 RepID=UPI0006230FA5|nr:PREDICTED: bolA-like protein DDB_G0274169 [Linepithema humile]XP_012224044.1 PREDICTED: bolA-like protein DDB_G0274169 [Linepithema humile]